VPGKAFVVRTNSTMEPLSGKFNIRLTKGERIRIESPGGGGWGQATESPR
jgi:N-methylhydantoinase B/oxoprolinase/acetone carboxylase alpha subunit